VVGGADGVSENLGQLLDRLRERQAVTAGESDAHANAEMHRVIDTQLAEMA
jgi:hypothetical protein